MFLIPYVGTNSTGTLYTGVGKSWRFSTGCYGTLIGRVIGGGSIRVSSDDLETSKPDFKVTVSNISETVRLRDQVTIAH